MFKKLVALTVLAFSASLAFEDVKESTTSRKDSKAQRNAECNSFGLFAALCGFAPLRETFYLRTNFFTPSFGQGRKVLSDPLVANGREALAALEKGDFDVALMDLQMPEMDGFEATAAIRAREKGVGKRLPIIAVTMNGDRQQCIDAGMDGYIAKPIAPAELFQTMAAVSVPRFGNQHVN